MKKNKAAFWDASAIVPLCCGQRYSKEAGRLVNLYSRMVVWWGTPVEIQAAFARLIREKEIETRQYETAARRLSVTRDGWSEITPTERVRELAERLPAQYRLRAADAFQLAAALAWSNEKPRNRPFISFDARLAASASDVGFEVVFHDYIETGH